MMLIYANSIPISLNGFRILDGDSETLPSVANSLIQNLEYTAE